MGHNMSFPLSFKGQIYHQFCDFYILFIFLRFVLKTNFMKKSVVNLLSGAMILTAMLSVSCGKDLAKLTIDLETPATGGANPVISQGETLEIPFTVGQLEGYSVTAEATCDNDSYTVAAEIDTNGKSGKVTLSAPEFIFEDASIIITLIVKDAENSRTTQHEITVDAVSVLETLAVSSNCHLVSPGSFIKFASVKGNSTEKVSAEKVELLWQDAAGLVDSTFTITKDEIYVNLAKELQGNAVVAAKDAEGTILWSWHIWVSAEDPTANLMPYTYTPAEGESQSFQFMDRNLGALSAELGTAAVNGCFYQWGRKDPFPGPTYEGTIKPIYNSKGEVIAVESASPEVTDNLENSIQNPLTRYCFTSSNNCNYSWITNNWSGLGFDAVKDLWGGVSNAKTMYDPCPAGYRIPKAVGFYFWNDKEVTKEKVFSNPESTAIADQMGKKVTIGDKSFYFPLQGEVNQGATFEAGYKKSGYGGGGTWPNGKHWTSQFDGSGNSSSYFRAWSTSVSPTSTSYSMGINLSYAVAVRCIKE